MKARHFFPGLLLLVVLAPFESSAQEKTPLFKDQNPLPVSFALSIKEIKGLESDTLFIKVPFAYQTASGTWDSLSCEMRARGIFRRKNCYFPPLRVHLKKKQLENTPFEDNKSLKLVMPCKTPDEFNTYIIKEFMCYKFYETISPYTFSTRLADITFTENSKEKAKVYKLKGFFIEDDDRVAKRFGGTIKEDIKLHPLMMSDTNSVRHDLFQYMIGNTDWSTVAQHNATLLELPGRRPIPMAYDFDMSGVVNASYATVDPSLGLTAVTDRLYRGFCRNDNVVSFVRKEFQAAEPAMREVLKQYASYLSKNDLATLRAFMDDFFLTLKNDEVFSRKVISSCRK